MNFEFSGDLTLLREQARRFMSEQCPTAAVRRVFERLATEPGVDRALWREVAEMGWQDTAVPEHDGGIGLGHEGMCVIAEELGRAPVSITTLMNERLAVGQSPGPDATDMLRLVLDLTLNGQPALADSAVRERLADWYVQAQGPKFTQFRTMTALSRGQTPGPEASIAKVVSANKLQAIASFGMDLLGQGGAVTDPALVPMQGWFQQALLVAPGMRIAGGTDEILRNIIAERVLGLPGDVRVDKDRPFNAPAGAPTSAPTSASAAASR